MMFFDAAPQSPEELAAEQRYGMRLEWRSICKMLNDAAFWEETGPLLDCVGHNAMPVVL